MDNPKSVWIWADPIPKFKCIWTSMNINNNRGSLTIANDLLVTPHSPLVFLYFSIKVGNKHQKQQNNIL